MLDEIPLRTLLALLVAAATGSIVLGLTGSVDATASVLAAGAVMVALVATAGVERRAEQPVVAETPDRSLIDRAIDAIAGPFLVVRDSRVARANAAARTLLGQHIVGEDVRLAIRHAGAADQLGNAGTAPARPVDLVGLGTLDQRWQMHAATIAPGLRLVHLVNQTGEYAAERVRVDFVANASHELRTPLASILGYVETLADSAGDDPATRQRFLGVVFNEARRMERLVEDLMSLSRIEADKFRPARDTLALDEIAEDVTAALADTHGERGRDIVLTIDRPLPPVTGDAVQMSQLLHNLVGNAMKYGRAGTPVTVTLAPAGDNVLLVVADEGEGIAPEHLPRLTERFYRVDAGRSRSLGGTGLGLAIVKHIVERHRGRLDIASRVGVGTRVSVTLPAAAAGDATAAATVIKA